MYPKSVIQRIVELWGLGFTAEETREVIKEEDGKTLCLDTIYRLRKSLTAQNLIEELLRRQERAIFKADTADPALGLKYRNELLKILLPRRLEVKEESYSEEHVMINVTEDEDKILSKAAAILSRKSPRQRQPGQLH